MGKRYTVYNYRHTPMYRRYGILIDKIFDLKQGQHLSLAFETEGKLRYWRNSIHSFLKAFFRFHKHEHSPFRIFRDGMVLRVCRIDAPIITLHHEDGSLETISDPNKL